MVKRKVIKQANQAYTITLPIEWVRGNGITEKSEVEINSSDKTLIVFSGNKMPVQKARADISGMNSRGIFRIINSLYAKGIDEIEIISKEERSKEIIYALSQAIGYALVSQSNGKYIIKDLGGGKYEDLDEIFKRVFQMILSFFDSAVTDIFGPEKETLEGLKARDQEINKFCIFLQRAINKKIVRRLDRWPYLVYLLL